MSITYQATSRVFKLDPADLIASQIAQRGVSGFISKTYNDGSTIASKFYNGEHFGLEIGNQIGITYGETLLTGKVIDSGTIRADFDPTKIQKVYHFINGETGAKGIKEGVAGVPESKLQNVFINCNAAVDADTGEAKIHGLDLKEMALPLALGAGLLLAPSIIKLFKHDPLTGKEIATSVAESGMSPKKLLGEEGKSLYVVHISEDGQKVVQSLFADYFNLVANATVNGGAGGAGGTGGTGGAGGGGGAGGCPHDGEDGNSAPVANTATKDCSPVTVSVTYEPPPEKSRSGMSLLIHHGESNRYWQEPISLKGKTAISIGMLYDALYLTEKKTSTSGNSTCHENGSVSIKWCILADDKVLSEGVISESGHSESVFTRLYSVSLAEATANARALAEGASCSPYASTYTDATLRIYRTDDPFTSSTDAYFEGYDYVEGQNFDNGPQVFTANATIPQSCQPVGKINDDNLVPRVRPAGSFGTSACPVAVPAGGAGGSCDESSGGAGGAGGAGSAGSAGQPGSNATVTVSAKNADGSNAAVDASAPTLVVDGQRDGIFAADVASNPMPSFTAALGNGSVANAVTVTFEVSQGAGSITTNTTSAPATFAWDAATKKATISGPLTNVNTILHGPLRYVPTSADATVDVTYTAKISDSDGKQGRVEGTLSLLNRNVERDAKSSNATVTITGTNGTIQLLSNGVAISNVVAFTSSIGSTGTALVASINGAKTTPDYSASGSGATFTVSATSALGSDANGWHITANATGDMAISGTPSLDGGVTKTKVNKGLGSIVNSKLFKLALPVVGAGLLAYTINKTLSKISVEIPESVSGEDPNVSVLYQGQMVMVPNNYDANTNTYTGSWDYSTFIGPIYTTNPAWCLLDFIKSKRYGCGQNIRMTDSQLTQLHRDIYACAVRCDEKPNNGRGGTGLRYTLNTQFASLTRQQALDSLCSTMHAQPVWSVDGLRIIQDRPDTPKAVVTPANVFKDSPISYSGGSLDASYNLVEVTYNDPDNFFVPVKTAVYKGSDVAINGERKNSITLFGCTDEAMAKRYAAWVLENEKSNPLIASYVAGSDHETLIPGDLIVLHDPVIANAMGSHEIGGRIVGVTSPGVYTVDRDGGTTGQTVWWSDANNVVQHGTATFSGRTMTVAGGTIPLNGVFATTASTTAADNIWKILSISDNDEGSFTVSAVKHNPAKYTAIDAFYSLT